MTTKTSNQDERNGREYAAAAVCVLSVAIREATMVAAVTSLDAAALDELIDKAIKYCVEAQENLVRAKVYFENVEREIENG